MSGFKQILARDMADLAGTTAFRILAAALAVIAIGLAAGAAAIISATPAGAESAEDPAAPALIGTMLYFATLLPFLVLLWVFAGAILTKEKASGHLETLLATPLSPRNLWLAKTSVIVLPGFLIAALSSALIAVAVALTLRARPDAGTFVFQIPFLIACAIGNPLLFSGLGALTVLLAMRSSPDAAIVPSFVLGFGLMTIVPAASALGLLDPASWAFASAYLAAGALEWTLVLVMERGLTKERIVLSSREE